MWTPIAIEVTAQASWVVSNGCIEPVASGGVSVDPKSVMHDIEELMAIAWRRLDLKPY
jgi:hypothetical protein